MGSAALGKGTSDVRISNLTPNGFSFRVGSEELFVSFGLFPWFRDATIGQITRVEAASENDLYWPDLDFDLSAESIRHPEQFPLVSKVRSKLTLPLQDLSFRHFPGYSGSCPVPLDGFHMQCRPMGELANGARHCDQARLRSTIPEPS